MAKVFKDPVHGNITIPSDICHDFIDTDLFQRLRFVEQSTMRTLFPSARHDRFIHSIGVYWMARKIFTHLKDRFRQLTGQNDELVGEMESTFLVAALLHDCAHSPFSHTGEIVAACCDARIGKLLVKEIGTMAFKTDFKSGKTHEIASAYVACIRFHVELERHHVNKEQFVRMIIGLPNGCAEDVDIRVYNILIGLLNGFALDADRLDYLLRDTWATGVANAAVDVDALVSGFDVDDAGAGLLIKGSALPGMLNAMYAREYLYCWIVSHHKVVFYNCVIPLAFHALCNELAIRSLRARRNKRVSGNVKRGNARVCGQIREKIFSPMRLLKKAMVLNEKVFLPTDGDILYLMKKYISRNKYVRAYLSRENVYAPLWKHIVEFRRLFKIDISRRDLETNEAFWREMCGCFHKYTTDNNIDALVSPPIQVLGRRSLGDMQVCARDLSGKLHSERIDSIIGQSETQAQYVFYCYISEKFGTDKSAERNRRNNIVSSLQEVFTFGMKDFILRHPLEPKAQGI